MPLRVIDTGEMEHHIRVEDQVHDHAAHAQHRRMVMGFKVGQQCNSDPEGKVSLERLSVLEAKQSLLRMLGATWGGHCSTARASLETLLSRFFRC